MIPEKKQIAILADIHSNFEAFRTCIEEAEKRNIHHYIFFGRLSWRSGLSSKNS